jgi:Ca2+-binding EF-hand superfamily protein
MPLRDSGKDSFVKYVGIICIGFIMTATALPTHAQTSQPVARASGEAPQRRAPVVHPISREAFLRSMDAQFHKMDANKDGAVTRAEVESFERNILVLQTQSRDRALFARLDTDRSGQLSWAEFARASSSPPTPGAAPTLKRFDLNRDGSISIVEYRTGTLSNFDRMDTDKDGLVSLAEMRARGAGE